LVVMNKAQCLVVSVTSVHSPLDTARKVRGCVVNKRQLLLLITSIDVLGFFLLMAKQTKIKSFINVFKNC